jgi:DNA-binding transcriptional MocR family regulator
MPINSFEDYPMSWRPVFNKDAKPLYTALADMLEEDIKNKKLLPGTKLPPQRELADFLDVNLSTVSRAFKICESKGLISGSVGSGTFVSYTSVSGPHILPHSESDKILELGTVYPKPETDGEIVKLLHTMTTENDFGKYLHYGNEYGELWHRHAGTAFIGKTGFEPDPDNVLFSTGSQNAICAILSGIFKSGDKIGADPLVFHGLRSAAKLFGIQLIPIAQKNGEMSRDGIINAYKTENISGLYVIPDHHNPTTHTMSSKCRKTIAELSKKYGLIIIEDSILSLMSRPPLSSIASLAPENTVLIASFSKIIASGLRFAYIAVPRQFKNDIANSLYTLNISVSPLMLEIASRLIVSGAADLIIERHRLFIIKRNQITNRIMRGYQCMGTSESLFRWLILPSNLDSDFFEQKALLEGVQVYSSTRFAIGNSKPVNAVRLAISAPKDDDELEKALKIIKNLLDKY